MPAYALICFARVNKNHVYLLYFRMSVEPSLIKYFICNNFLVDKWQLDVVRTL